MLFINERMGELRDSPNQAGVWARVQGGEQKFKKTDMDFQTFQFGIDRRIEALDNAYLGVAFSYSDADLDYEQGSGTNKLYSLGVYGSWLGETGSYLDLIAKIGRLESDAKIALPAVFGDADARDVEPCVVHHRQLRGDGFRHFDLHGRDMGGLQRAFVVVARRGEQAPACQQQI